MHLQDLYIHGHYFDLILRYISVALPLSVPSVILVLSDVFFHSRLVSLVSVNPWTGLVSCRLYRYRCLSHCFTNPFTPSTSFFFNSYPVPVFIRSSLVSVLAVRPALFCLCRLLVCFLVNTFERTLCFPFCFVFFLFTSSDRFPVSVTSSSPLWPLAPLRSVLQANAARTRHRPVIKTSNTRAHMDRVRAYLY